MQHTKLVEWERKLRQACRAVDAHLEEKYGEQFPLHPARPEHGTTANVEHDGLFNVGGAFSAGFGSNLGRGYILQINVSTLENIPREFRQQIEDEAAVQLRKELGVVFPDRNLIVERDGNVHKISGDLSLGSL